MLVYITKYALTKGIYETQATAHGSKWLKDSNPERLHERYYGSDWHKTIEEAKDKAQKMKEAKIASLKRQLEKLESITF